MGRITKGREEGDEASGGADCVACLEGQSGKFNYEGGQDFPSQW